MANTSIKNDPIRIYKNLQQSTDVGRHILNVPGNGLDVPFINDPQVRMQRWGANHMTDIIGVENSLMGIDRRLTRECMESKYTQPDTSRMDYSTGTFNVTESFITQPGWNLKDYENTGDLGYPIEENDAHIFIPFNNNLGTRIHEKDLFCRK